jgi:hypothetical protein
MAQFDATPDEQSRAKIAEQVALLQHDEVPTVISYFITGLRGVRKNVQNIETGPVDHMDASQVWLSA